MGKRKRTAGVEAVGEVYYWDNDQLPQAILATLPKLEIGNRVGEDSVSKIFGVKLAKNVDISFSNQVNNDGLLKEMKNIFQIESSISLRLELVMT